MYAAVCVIYFLSLYPSGHGVVDSAGLCMRQCVSYVLYAVHVWIYRQWRHPGTIRAQLSEGSVFIYIFCMIEYREWKQPNICFDLLGGYRG